MLNLKKSAFTMLELVMVIVVLGILAALAMPRMDRDIRQEAADSILSAIRYTQHLALMDNVQGDIKPGDTATFRNDWQRSLWNFGFQGCSDHGIFYYVASDTNRLGNIDAGEEAVDPANGLPLNGRNTESCETEVQTGISPNIFITKQFGILDTDIAFSGGCDYATAQHIAFDNMGRPHTNIRSSSVPDYSTVMHQDCNMTFSFEDSSITPVTITIEKETGYAHIVGQPNS